MPRQRAVVVFSCCGTNHHKFGSWKRHPFISSEVCRSASRWGQMGSLLGVSQGQSHVICWSGLFSGGSGEELTLRLIHIGGTIQILEVAGPRFLFPCWLSSPGTLTLPQGQLHSFLWGPLLPSSNQRWRVESFSCLGSPLSPSLLPSAWRGLWF